MHLIFANFTLKYKIFDHIYHSTQFGKLYLNYVSSDKLHKKKISSPKSNLIYMEIMISLTQTV